jgi:CheY-like chemotaxis protein
MAVILVVDDEAMIRSLVSAVLSSAGHQVLQAGNGVEGIALFRSFSRRIDLVVTDLIMPVMDGHELVRMVLRDQPSARILCMSGYADDPPPGGTELLAKPFRPDELRKAVDRMLAS